MSVILLSAIFLVSTVHGLHLPKYIKPCRYDSPDFKQCAIKNGNEAVPHLMKGDRAYGIPSFVPFKISFVTIGTGGLEMNMTEATFSGIEAGRVVDYYYDIKKKKAYSTVTAPVILFDFDYSVKGQIVSLPLEGHGHGWTKIYNANYTYAYDFDVKEQDGNHYMVFGEESKVTIDPEKVEIELTNLFNGNKQLGDNLNKFLNENWKEWLAEFGPVIDKVFGTISREVLGKIYTKIPLEEIFPGMVF